MSNGSEIITGQLPESHLHELTGLPNRRWLNEQLPAIIAETDGHVAILAIDADGIKDINDATETIAGVRIGGHEEGDEYIKNLAVLIESDIRSQQGLEYGTRSTDVLAVVEPFRQPDALRGTSVHISGDEFIVVLRVAVTEDDVLGVADRLKASLDEYGVPISVGTAVYQSGESVKQFLQRADAQLYSDKIERKKQANTPEQLATFWQVHQICTAAGINMRDLPLLGPATGRSRLGIS